MKKLVVPVFLIIVGVIVIILGQRRSDSVEGIAATVGTKIANTWDGKARQPGHVWYYIGGGALIVAGVAAALSKSSSA